MESKFATHSNLCTISPYLDPALTEIISSASTRVIIRIMASSIATVRQTIRILADGNSSVQSQQSLMASFPISKDQPDIAEFGSRFEYPEDRPICEQNSQQGQFQFEQE